MLNHSAELLTVKTGSQSQEWCCLSTDYCTNGSVRNADITLNVMALRYQFKYFYVFKDGG